jgi:aarF domain-containing kinase
MFISYLFYCLLSRSIFFKIDPHEANLLVRKHPTKGNGAPQIVLLDHGLYRKLSDKFRRDYCRLWQGIVLSNPEQIQKYCKEMNAGEIYPLLASIVTKRPWDDIVSNDLDRYNYIATYHTMNILS